MNIYVKCLICAHLTKEKQDLQVQLNASKAENQAYKNEIDELKSRLNKMQSEIQNEKKELCEYIKKLLNDKKVYENELTKYNVDLKKLTDEKENQPNAMQLETSNVTSKKETFTTIKIEQTEPNVYSLIAFPIESSQLTVAQIGSNLTQKISNDSVDSLTNQQQVHIQANSIIKTSVSTANPEPIKLSTNQTYQLDDRINPALIDFGVSSSTLNAISAIELSLTQHHDGQSLFSSSDNSSNSTRLENDLSQDSNAENTLIKMEDQSDSTESEKINPKKRPRVQSSSNNPRKHKCNWEGCQSSFKTTSDLNRHIKIHTGEKPYSCQYNGCVARFAEKSKLKVHERTHTGEKPYKCEFEGCQVGFTRRGFLKTHMKNSHGNSI